MARFVTPETVQLELSDGDWIEVKERLNLWEREQLTGTALGGLSASGDGDAQVGLNYARYAIQKLETWLVDWSFVDGDDKRVEVSLDAIRNLDPDTADEIDAALDAHIAAMEELKKVSNGEKKSISESP